MRTKIQTSQLDITQPVELVFQLGEEQTPFTVTGSYEDVAPIAEQIQASDARTARRTRVAPNIGHTVMEQPKRLVEGLLGRVSIDVKAKAYDFSNGTNFLGALREKRQLDKDLRMAQSLGLLTVDVCAKHRKALEDVKKVR